MSALLGKAKKWYIDASVAATKAAAKEQRIPFTGADEQALRRDLQNNVDQADPQQLIAMYEAAQQGQLKG